MPVVERLDGLLAKTQPIAGTDAVPVVGTDAVRIGRRLWSFITVDYNWPNMRSGVATGTITPAKPGIPRGRKVRLDLMWEARGAGADVPPEADPLLRACGFTQTDGALLFQYTQASQNHEMASIYAYAGNILFKCIDCRGRFRWPLAVGEIAMFQFTMFGVLAEDSTETALPGGFVYDATEPVAGVNTGLSIGGVAMDWLNGEFDPIGLDPILLESGNALDGIAGFDYGDTDPTFRLNFRKVALSTYNPLADLKARTTKALLMTFGPAVAFNRIKLLSTNLSLKEHRPGSSQGFVNWDAEFFVESWTLQFD
jgi:hypothetical protein